MSNLVKRLRIKAGMIEMGEMIAWGSDSALMREAADALEMASPAVQGEPVGYGLLSAISKNWDGKTFVPKDDADGYDGSALLPLYTTPQPAEQQPDVTQLVEAPTELCDEIDNHEIHAVISKTSISWFKRKARAVLAAHHIEDNGNE